MTRHIIHANSKENAVNQFAVTSKLPNSDRIAEGEIAVNYKKNSEALIIKNSNNNIVPIASSEILTKELGLEDTFHYSPQKEGYISASTSISNAIDSLDKKIRKQGEESPFSYHKKLSNINGSGIEPKFGETNASGDFSFAEGNNTSATSLASHAEGYFTQANGLASHAEGYYTIVTNEAECANGKYNKPNEIANQIYSVGIGTDENNRKNAIAIGSNGDIYVPLDTVSFDFVKLQEHIKTVKACTQNEYDGLGNRDDNTIYLIKREDVTATTYSLGTSGTSNVAEASAVSALVQYTVIPVYYYKSKSPVTGNPISCTKTVSFEKNETTKDVIRTGKFIDSYGVTVPWSLTQKGDELLSTTYELGSNGTSNPVEADVTSATVNYTVLLVFHYRAKGNVTGSTISCSRTVTFDKNTSDSNVTRSGSFEDDYNLTVPWSLTQKADEITSTTYILGASGTSSSVTAEITSATVSYTDLPVYHYRAKGNITGSSVSLTHTVTFNKNTTASNITRSGSFVDSYSVTVPWSLTQKADEITSTSYILGTSGTSSSVKASVTSATVSYTDLPVYHYRAKGNVTGSSISLTHTVTFGKNTSASDITRSGSFVDSYSVTVPWSLTQKGAFVIEYIDLGLSSGTKWANANLGAESIASYGKYFQWGDTVGYTDASHSTWATAPFNNGSSTYNESYWKSISGSVVTLQDGYYNLKPQYDAVSANTAGVAHMPTYEDCVELVENTTTATTTVDSIKGIKFTSKSDSSKYIFIPFADAYKDGKQDLTYTHFYLWSSSLYSTNKNEAYILYSLLISSSYSPTTYYNSRYVGSTIRGVVSTPSTWICSGDGNFGGGTTATTNPNGVYFNFIMRKSGVLVTPGIVTILKNNQSSKFKGFWLSTDSGSEVILTNSSFNVYDYFDDGGSGEYQSVLGSISWGETTFSWTVTSPDYDYVIGPIYIYYNAKQYTQWGLVYGDSNKILRIYP